MRTLVLIFLTFFFLSEINAQTIFKLDGSQSMLMTGKGPGQDATINPFQGVDCFAVIENLGQELISARIQKNGKLISITPVASLKREKIKLLANQELYLDSETKNTAKARVS
jgi:hypothetical protein